MASALRQGSAQAHPLPSRAQLDDAGDPHADGAQRLPLVYEGLLSGSLGLVRRAGVVLVVQVAGAGLAYLLQVLLARLLGASGYGVYSYVFICVTFVALLAGLGLPAAAVRYVPVYRMSNDWARMRGFIRLATIATFTMAIATALVASLVALLAQATGLLAHAQLIVLAGLLLPALAGSMLYMELARAENRVAIAFVPALVARPLLIGAFAALIALAGGLSTKGARVATTLAAYLVLLVQHLLTRRSVQATPATRPVIERREWLRVGAALLAVNAFIVTLMQVDVVIVGAARGARDAGIYAAASKTASLVAFVIVAVNAAAAPQFATLWAQGRRADLQRLVSRLARLIFWPSLAICAGIALLSGPLLSLFGSGFRDARGALLVLLVGQLVNAVAGSVGYLLTLTGHHRVATRALAASALASIALTAVGAWTFGLLGAAAGSTIGFILWNGLLYRLVVSRLGIHASILAPPVRWRRPQDG
jgi:O-antigen/teichoic acid export membrane protein